MAEGGGGLHDNIAVLLASLFAAYIDDVDDDDFDIDSIVLDRSFVDSGDAGSQNSLIPLGFGRLSLNKGAHSETTINMSYAAFSDIPYEQNQLEIIHRLLKSVSTAAATGRPCDGDILNTTRDRHGNTHLHAAARLGRTRAVTILLQVWSYT